MLKFIISSIIIFSTQISAEPLVAGSPAPPLKVEHWLQGEPVPAFKTGQVYLVEFWGTWCGPCINAIPHLNALAKEYGERLTVLGIATRELEDNPEEQLATVREFLSQGEPAMNYAVGLDSSKQTDQLWMKAAYRMGIPSSFVVDRDGTIAYIGHPLTLDHEETGNPLKQIIEGTWAGSADRAKYVAQAQADLPAAVAEFKVRASLRVATKEGDWQAALLAVREAIEAIPAPAKKEYQFKESEILITKLGRPGEGIARLEPLIKANWNDAAILAATLPTLAHKESRALPMGEVLAAQVAKRIVELVDHNPDAEAKEQLQAFLWYYFQPVAAYYFESGKPDLAVSMQKQILQSLDKNPQYASYRAELVTALDRYQAALKPKATPFCKDGVCEIPSPSTCEDGMTGKS